MRKHITRVLLLMVLVGFGSLARAEADPILMIQPSAQNVPPGSVSADIVVSGLTNEIISSFSTLLTFNPSVLSFASYTIGNSLLPGDLVLSFDGTDTSQAGSGVLDFFYSYGGLASDLDAAQTSPFVLASIFFNGSPGFSELNLSLAGEGATPLTNVADNPDGVDLAATLQNGTVCVSESGAPCQSAPEPATLALLGAGISALAIRRRAAAKARRS